MKNSIKKNSKSKEAVLEVSHETYRKQLAKGLDPESLLKPGRHRFRRSLHTIKPGEEVYINGKVRVTIRLDADIVEFFKGRAPHYQTEINTALRRIVDSAGYEQELISDVMVERLADKLAQTLKSSMPLER
ncbi:MAG: BrnA antitoxin family protein [Pyrinomonadaceae bacterium]